MGSAHSRPMLKRFRLACAILLSAIANLAASEITLYTHRHYEADDLLFAEFTKASGIKVNVVKSGADQLMEETLEAANLIAGYGKTAAIVAREAVDRALEVGLREGILFERRTYYALWATQDAQEGMAAFVEKRPPAFVGR